MKCGHPAGRCRQEGGRGHGPDFALVRSVDGKSAAHSQSPEATAETPASVG